MNINVKKLNSNDFWKVLAFKIDQENEQMIMNSFFDLVSSNNIDQLSLFEKFIDDIQSSEYFHFFNNNKSKLCICGLDKVKIEKTIQEFKKNYTLQSFNKINKSYLVILNKAM